MRMSDATQKWPLFQSDLEIHAAALVMLTHDVTTLASASQQADIIHTVSYISIRHLYRQPYYFVTDNASGQPLHVRVTSGKEPNFKAP